jgi:hypothetical protein
MACTTGIDNDRPPSLHEYQDTLEFFLCRACRYLSKQQIESIIREEQSRFCNTTNRLDEWYKKHLEEDYVYEKGHKHRPDSEITKNEIERIKNGKTVPTQGVYPY